MPYRMLDYRCEACGHEFDALAHLPEDDQQPVPCESCGEPAHQRSWMATAPRVKTIVKGNSDYAQRERERLTKRSTEHYKKAGHDEAIERQRMQWRREGMLRDA